MNQCTEVYWNHEKIKLGLALQHVTEELKKKVPVYVTIGLENWYRGL